MFGVTGETVRDRMRQIRMIREEEKDLTTHSFRIDAAIKSRELIFRRYYYIQKMAVMPTPRMSVSTPEGKKNIFFLMCLLETT